MALGGGLFVGSSKLLEGPLGVVQLGFNGYDLGQTTADAVLTPDQDIKDINYQQEGTKPADHVRTGIEYMVAVTFGEINTGLLELLMAGVSTRNTDANADSGVIGRSVYQSMLETEAGILKIAAVDENGVASEDADDIMYLYLAIPVVTADLIVWGADTQRGLPMQFRCKYRKLSSAESPTAGHKGAFGYWGDPTVEDVPAVVWPDVEAPTLVSATADAATNMDIIFNEDIAFQTAFDVDHFVAKVEGAYIVSTAGTITDATLSLTFGASSFTDGDVIEISISELSLQDTEATPNTYDGVDGHAAINTVP